MSILHAIIIPRGAYLVEDTAPVVVCYPHTSCVYFDMNYVYTLLSQYVIYHQSSEELYTLFICFEPFPNNTDLQQPNNKSLWKGCRKKENILVTSIFLPFMH